MRAIPGMLCGLLMAAVAGLGQVSAQETLPPAMVPSDPAAAGVPVAPALADAEPVLARGDVEAWLDGFVPYALATGDIAGAVVVVVGDGQVLLQKGYGYSDLAKRAPEEPEAALVRPGSNYKLCTWTASMQLA